MKRNNIYTALLSLSLLSLGACSLDLEPLTSPSFCLLSFEYGRGEFRFERCLLISDSL